MKDNAFTAVSVPEALNQATREIDGKLVQQRIGYWMNLFFKFDKGKYATRSKHLKHDWYLTQVEVCSNVIFKSARFCTSLFESTTPSRWGFKNLSFIYRHACGPALDAMTVF